MLKIKKVQKAYQMKTARTEVSDIAPCYTDAMYGYKLQIDYSFVYILSIMIYFMILEYSITNTSTLRRKKSSATCLAIKVYARSVEENIIIIFKRCTLTILKSVVVAPQNIYFLISTKSLNRNTDINFSTDNF